VYLHLVWGTWDRVALITPVVEPGIYACLAQKCRELHCDPVAIGATGDHVHVLVRVHPTISAAMLAKHLKAATSHLINHVLAPRDLFRWRSTYGAFSVSPGDLDRVRAYIEHQKQHHADASIQPDWERCFEPEGEHRPTEA
jgi:REP element-mobilizing transposase RayT